MDVGGRDRLWRRVKALLKFVAWLLFVQIIYAGWAIYEWHIGGRTAGWYDFHIGIPFAVLTAEFVMIYKMVQESDERHRESEERHKTDEEMRTFRESLGREHYLQQISLMISQVQREFLFTSISMEASWQSPQQREIFDEVVKRRSGSDPNYVHRGIVSERAAVIPGALQMRYHGYVQIRVSKISDMTRVRFCIRDRESILFGIADGRPDIGVDQPSNKSVSINSKTVAEAMRGQFFKIWDQSTDLILYLEEFVKLSVATLPECSRQGYRDITRLERADIPDSWMAFQSRYYSALWHFELLNARDYSLAELSQMVNAEEINLLWKDDVKTWASEFCALHELLQADRMKLNLGGQQAGAIESILSRM